MLVFIFAYFYHFLFIFAGCFFLIKNMLRNDPAIHLTVSILDIVLFVFNGILIASALFAGDHPAAGSNLYSIFAVDFMYLVIRLALSPGTEKNIRQLLIFLVVLGFIESVIGILQFNGILKAINPLYKVSGSFGNPGVYANFLATILPISLMYSFAYKKQRLLRDLFFPVTSLLILFILVITVARASWIAAILSLIILAWLYNTKCKEMVRSGLSALYKPGKKGILVAIFMASLLVLFLSYLFLVKKDSTVGRIFVYRNAIEMVRDHPVAGIGFDQFKIKYNDYQESYFRNNKDQYYEKVASDSMVAFNEYLQICAELGIVGLLSFLLLVFTLIRIYRSDINRGPLLNSIFISIFAVLALALFSYPFRTLATLVNTVLFMAILSSRDPRPVYRLTLANPGRKLTLLSFFTITLALTSYGVKSMSAMIDWRKASLLAGAGNVAGSDTAYGEIYPALKHDGLFLYEYGTYLCHNKEYSTALPILDEAKVLLNYYDVYVRIGICYENMGEPSKAEEAYLKACYMVPNRFYPRYKLMSFYVKNNRREMAVQWARTISRMDIKSASPVVDEIRKKADSTLKSFANKF